MAHARLLFLIAFPALSGCAAPHEQVHPRMSMPLPGVTRVAIAPVMNFSGEPSLDPLKAADLLASEMSEVAGITIVPVNRVAAALDRQGTPFVQSPAHAIDICRTVGSDAILVPAVTEYNPYPPMVVGLLMELYVVPGPRVDPVGDPTAGSGPPHILPAAQVQLVLNSAHDSVVKQVRHYAEPRSAADGPFAWRRYLVAQEQYLRFCFHRGLKMMLNPDSNRMARGETSDE